MSAAYLQAPAVAPRPYRSGRTGKAAYASRADALFIARQYALRFPPYQRGHCKLWHVTSTGKLRTLAP